VTDIELAAVASRRIDAVQNDATTGRDDYKAAWVEFESAVAKINEAMALN
jgi:hypothetical protein